MCTIGNVPYGLIMVHYLDSALSLGYLRNAFKPCLDGRPDKSPDCSAQLVVVWFPNFIVKSYAPLHFMNGKGLRLLVHWSSRQLLTLLLRRQANYQAALKRSPSCHRGVVLLYCTTTARGHTHSEHTC